MAQSLNALDATPTFKEDPATGFMDRSAPPERAARRERVTCSTSSRSTSIRSASRTSPTPTISNGPPDGTDPHQELMSFVGRAAAGRQDPLRQVSDSRGTAPPSPSTVLSEPSLSRQKTVSEPGYDVPRSTHARCYGEVSERSKERDWKSRTCCKVRRGFKSRPLRFSAGAAAPRLPCTSNYELPGQLLRARGVPSFPSRTPTLRPSCR
jgi:hypothetical protein